MTAQGRTRSRRTVLIAVLAAVVVVVGAAGAWAMTHRTSATPVATTQLVAATTTTLKQTVSATGTIQPAHQANLQFGQSGKVNAVDVGVGQQVAAGATLATIDPTTLQSAVTLARAQLTAAQAQLTAATTATTTAAGAAQIASANAQVASAQNRATAAQQALDQASLTTPLAGTVAAVSITVGDQVTGSSTGTGSSSGSGSSTAPTGSGSASGAGSAAVGAAASSTGSSTTSASSAQIVVISTQSWLVNASVGAADLPSLKPGLQATITPSGASDPVFGTISTVGVIGTSSGGTSTFPVTIAVTGTPTGLYAGSTATVLITVTQRTDVLTVPTAAVHDVGGQSVVHQMKDGQQVDTVVGVGAVSGAVTEITAGLKDGDQVVVAARAATPRGAGSGATGGAGGLGGGGLGGGGLGGGGFGGGGAGGGTGGRG